MQLLDNILSAAQSGTVSVQGNEAKAAALNYKLGVSSGAYPSIGTGTGQSVTVKKVVDTPTMQSVSNQAYTVNTDPKNVANVTVKKTASVGSVISSSIFGDSDGTKKDVTFNLFNNNGNGNQLPGSNPAVYLPFGGNNNQNPFSTVYLPFGGNNNQQPGSNPYIIMPGGTGSSTDNSTGLDWTMLLILGAVGLGGAYLIGGRKK